MASEKKPELKAGDPTAQQQAAKLLAELVAGGMRWLVLAPGSRSQSLAIAAEQLERAGALNVLVRIDERSAGFVALGIAKATGLPVGLVVTSGTAVANLHPAILEASHSGLPLVAITADRPEELQGVGANQTTDQLSIFGTAIRTLIQLPASHQDAAAQALAVFAGPNPGPVQINFAAREPLSDSTPDAATLFKKLPKKSTAIASSKLPKRPDWLAAKPAAINGKKRGVIIAGVGAGAQAAELAEALNWPLLAEPGSGARHATGFIARYAELLLSEYLEPLLGELKQVVVLGKPTLGRGVPRLLAQPNLEITVVAAPGFGKFDVAHTVKRWVPAVTPSDPADDEWITRWRIAAGRISQLEQPEASDGNRFNRREVVQTLMGMHGFTDQLFVGASRPARDLDLHLRGSDRGVMLSRGLAGIDGSISTTLGLAAALQADPAASPASKVRAFIGDVTATHDIGGLNLSDVDPKAAERIQVVVLNDGGGTIFRGLEIAKTASPELLTRYFETPQRVDFAAVAAGFGWRWMVANSAESLRAALAEAGPLLIEVRLD